MPSMLLRNFFAAFRVTFFFQTNHVYIEMHHVRTLFVCHRTVSMAAVYHLKIKYENQLQYIIDNGAMISGHGIKRALICVTLGVISSTIRPLAV